MGASGAGQRQHLILSSPLPWGTWKAHGYRGAEEGRAGGGGDVVGAAGGTGAGGTRLPREGQEEAGLPQALRGGLCPCREAPMQDAGGVCSGGPGGAGDRWGPGLHRGEIEFGGSGKKRGKVRGGPPTAPPQGLVMLPAPLPPQNAALLPAPSWASSEPPGRQNFGGDSTHWPLPPTPHTGAPGPASIQPWPLAEGDVRP